MRIRRLFSSVLAALALMYASGCNETCQQVAGYNVYGGYPYGTQVNTEALAYNAAYNPAYTPEYGSGISVAPAPAAVAYNYPKANVRRTKTRYANTRPTKQRFTQVNPYAYGQPIVGQTYATQSVIPSAAATNFNYVPTVTFNTDGVSGLTTAGVAHDTGSGVAYQPTGVSYQPAGIAYQPVQSTVYTPPVQPAYDYSIPSGSNVQAQTVYRRGRPIRQRYRKVRWVPTQPVVQQPVQQYVQPAPVYTPPVTTTYTPPPFVEPYVPPVEPVSIPEPVPAPPPEPQVIRHEVNTIINPVIEPTIEPKIKPVIEPQIKPVIEPTIRTRIEPTPVVDQPIQQPIVQPVVIQPIIQPVIQSPIQEYQAPVQVAMQEPVYAAPPPVPAYVPPPMPAPAPASPGYCPPDICPAPNPMVCQPGQNLSECFTLNDYQVMNSPTQIYMPNVSAPLSVSVDNAIIGSMDYAVDPGLANMNMARGEPTASIVSSGQSTTSKYEALPMASGPVDQSGFGMQQPMMQQQMVQQPMMQQPMMQQQQMMMQQQPMFGQGANIPPVPAATEIENALDAMLSRDQMTPNLK